MDAQIFGGTVSCPLQKNRRPAPVHSRASWGLSWPSSLVPVRASDMGALAAEFFKSDLTVWFTGAALLFEGLFVIAFH
jgi:hypothetical protein